jgi:hypothetical protein
MLKKNFKELTKNQKKKAAPIVIKCTYWNTRGLGDGFKRHLTLE